MIDKKLQDVIVEVEQGLSQAAGLSTQVYSQDFIATLIQNAFDFLSRDPDKDWKRFQTFETFTLTGTDGRTTVPVNTKFKTFDDIKLIYPNASQKPLAYFNLSVNPSQINGTNALKYCHDTVDIIKVIPVTAQGAITIIGNVYPLNDFELDDTIPFDYLALKWYVIWKYMIQDGSNPGAAELARQEFQTRYEHLFKAQGREPIALDGVGGPDIPTDWFTNP